jgi:hypothetical protein
VRLQLEIAREVVTRLEMVRECLSLVVHVESLRRHLKLKTLALSSLQHTIAHQESRLLWLKEGDVL